MKDSLVIRHQGRLGLLRDGRVGVGGQGTEMTCSQWELCSGYKTPGEGDSCLKKKRTQKFFFKT